MFRHLRPAAALAALILVAFGLAGCEGDAAERTAFIEFLQTRIVDRPGLHIPIMSARDIKNFGPYADQYRIMNGFHHRVDAAVETDLVRAVQVGKPASIQDLADKRALFPIIRDGMGKFKSEIERSLAEADAAHAALKQPRDLKLVYDRAYDRMVTKPATTFLELVPMILGAIASVEELANFLDRNRGVIEYRNGIPASHDAEVRRRLETLMAAAADAAKASEDGKRKLRAMAEGK